MLEECAPPIPVSRLLGRSGFGNAVGTVEASARNNSQEIIFLGGCLMWNDAAVCGGRDGSTFDGATPGTWTVGDGVGAVEWYRGAVGVYVSRRVYLAVIVIPLGRSN